MDLGVFQLEDTWTGISGSNHGEPWPRRLTPEPSPCSQFLLSVFADSLLLLTLPLTAVRLEGCFVESVVEVNRSIFFFCWLNVIWLLSSLPSPRWSLLLCSYLCLILILLFFFPLAILKDLSLSLLKVYVYHVKLCVWVCLQVGLWTWARVPMEIRGIRSPWS